MQGLEWDEFLSPFQPKPFQLLLGCRQKPFILQSFLKACSKPYFYISITISIYKLCIYEKSPLKCYANTDGSHSWKLRKTLKVTAKARPKQGQAQGGNCSWIHPHGSSSAWPSEKHCLPFPALGTPRGCDQQEAQIYFSDSSTADFTAFLLLVWDQTESHLSLGVIASSGMEIAQQQIMCSTWIFLRMELFAQNKAVISTINYLQEAGPVSQHLLHLPVFILVGRIPPEQAVWAF